MKSLSPEIDKLLEEQSKEAAIASAIVADEVSKEIVKKGYEDKEKVKPLTDKQRIDRIEELFGIK